MDPDYQAALLEALAAALSRSQGRRVTFLQILYSDATSDLVAVPQGPVPGQGHPDPPPSGQPERHRRQEGVRERIIEALEASDRPLKAHGLARRIGRSNSGSFRELLREMIEDGEVEEHPGHTYWAPGMEVSGQEGDN